VLDYSLQFVPVPPIRICSTFTFSTLLLQHVNELLCLCPSSLPGFRWLIFPFQPAVTTW
jgi:hypothetical protein